MWGRVHRVKWVLGSWWGCQWGYVLVWGYGLVYWVWVYWQVVLVSMWVSR